MRILEIDSVEREALIDCDDPQVMAQTRQSVEEFFLGDQNADDSELVEFPLWKFDVSSGS